MVPPRSQSQTESHNHVIETLEDRKPPQLKWKVSSYRGVHGPQESRGYMMCLQSWKVVSKGNQTVLVQRKQTSNSRFPPKKGSNKKTGTEPNLCPVSRVEAEGHPANPTELGPPNSVDRIAGPRRSTLSARYTLPRGMRLEFVRLTFGWVRVGETPKRGSSGTDFCVSFRCGESAKSTSSTGLE